jgi:hypothetical protein
MDRAAPAAPCADRVPLPFDPLAPTIFHQPWWLATVTGGIYGEAHVSLGGRTVGRFPYVMARVLGGHAVCGMPVLTHFLGPAIDEGQGAACNRILRRAQITRDLLRQVPKSSGFWQKLHCGTPDTLAYQEQGYETSVQFTFEVAPAAATTLWQAMRDKTRNVIRRAEEQHMVQSLDDFDAFAALYIGNLARNRQRSYYAAKLIADICAAAKAHGQGRVIGARTAGGQIAAAIFYIWDARSAYYLLSTRKREATNGAVSLLIWHAMQDIAARGLIFDFEGVSTSGSALFFTGFGGLVAPRYVVSRFSLGHRIAGRLANPLRKRNTETYI